MRLLVADDQGSNRIFLTRILEKMGHEVVPCENGLQVLELANNGTIPQLLLLDWMMPNMTGVQVCEALRKMKNLPYIHIVMLTSRSEPEDILTGMRAGANDYLTKPIKIDEFQRQFHSAVQMVELNNVIAQQKLAVIQAYKLVGIGQMAQTLIAEMSTPVTAMLEQLDTLSEAIEAGDKTAMRRIRENLSASALHIGKTIRGVGLLAHDADGGESEPISSVSVAHSLQQLAEYFTAHASNKNVDILFGPVDRSLTFRGRGKEVSQALSNLIEYAIDSAAGQRERWVNVEVNIESGRIILAVTNSGPPVPDGARAQLLGPITADKATGETGNGLGLSIAKDIISRNGGTLALDPDSKRTRLVVAFPLASATEQRKAAA